MDKTLHHRAGMSPVSALSPEYFRFRLRLLAGLLVVACLTIFAVSWKIHSSATDRERAARTQSQAYAHAIAAHVADSIEVADYALAGFANAIKLLPPEQSSSVPMLRKLIVSNDAASSDAFWMMFIDAKGLCVAASKRPEVQGTSYADRDYFRVHADTRLDRGLFIAEPVTGKVTKRHIFIMSRRVLNARGEFIGVIAVPMEASRFAAMLERARMNADIAILLVHQGGKIIAGAPMPGQSFSASIPDSFLGHQPDLPFQAASPADGRLMSYSKQALESWPLCVFAGISMQSLKQARQEDLLIGGSGILLMAMVMFLLARVALSSYCRLEMSKQALQESEYHWKFALEGAGDGMFDWDIGSGKVVVSKLCMNMLGYAEGEMDNTLDAWFSHVHPDDQPRVLARRALFFAGADLVYVSEYRMRCKDGNWKWMLSRGMVISRNGAGQALRMIGTHADINDRKQAEQAQVHRIVEAAPDPVLLVGMDHGITFANVAAQITFGFTLDELKGQNIHNLLPNSSHHVQWLDAFERKEPWSGAMVNTPLTAVHREGSQFPVEISLTPFRMDGEAVVIANIRDISAQKLTERHQAMEYTVTLLLAESDTLGIAVPRIIECMCESLDWDCGAFWHLDKQTQQLTCAASWSAGSAGPAQFLEASSRQNFTPGETELICSVWMSGEPVWISDVAADPGFVRAAIAAEAGLHAAFAFPVRVGHELYGVMEFFTRDVRQAVPALLALTRSIGSQIGHFIARKEAEDEIRQAAFYDPLTGLPNRRLLSDRLLHGQAASLRSKRHGGLLFIDLDNFKAINDTLGHDKGDLLLQQVAARLAGCVRVGDTVARQGGDEFVIMLMDLSEVAQEAALQTEAIGEKILEALNRPYQLADHVYHNSASIGATLFDGQLESTDEHLKRADLAMYQAKAAGRNTLRFFEAEMQAAVSQRAALETDLRQGLQEGQFELYYQAQVNGAGRVTGAEAQLRWQHPQRGFVAPDEFIPAAEESGLILPLGRWVLETACRQLAAWSGVPATAQLSLAVNVSARQFRQPDFLDQVVELLERSGADPRRLKLELTESMLLDNVEQVITKMSMLKALGVGFSLDDFGTGYSSLSYLKRLPLDQIKIDQSFVRDVLSDPNDAAIVRTIVALAHSLGLEVIAEGVETVPQRDFLAALGCHAYQGYLFSQPVPLDQFELLSVHHFTVPGLADPASFFAPFHDASMTRTKIAPHPDNEADRLASLHALAVLDSAPEAEFDALVLAASLACGMPVSLISLVDSERQWFKANTGLPGTSETARDIAFCSHAILDDGLFEVTDALQDPRFADNPLVAGQPGIRFYAGAPLRLSDGSRIGTLCVIDRKPGRLDARQRQILLCLADVAAAALEGRRATQLQRQQKQESHDQKSTPARALDA